MNKERLMMYRVVLAAALALGGCAIEQESGTGQGQADAGVVQDPCPEAHYDQGAPACQCGTEYMNKSGGHNVPDNCHVMECDGASDAGGRLADLHPGETCIVALCCDLPAEKVLGR
jgi:hypothetical protein